MNKGNFIRSFQPLFLLLFFALSYPDICLSCNETDEGCFHPPHEAIGVGLDPDDELWNGLPFNELYYAQPHNSYYHGEDLKDWLKAGYRTLEIDVHDRWEHEEKWWNGRGPHVGHNDIHEYSNCGGIGARLGDCFTKIIEWQNLNRDHLPLLVFIDMKSRQALDPSQDPWDPFHRSHDWNKYNIKHLDEWVGAWLGDKMYKYSELLDYIGK